MPFHQLPPQLQQQALTHPSAQPANSLAFQRLEFLGDRVLGLWVAQAISQAFPQATEGELGRHYARLVSTTMLAQVAQQWQVAPHVQVARGATAQPAMLADVVEAILGALYLHGGWSAIQQTLAPTYQAHLHQPTPPDPKTALQEHLQSQGHSLPTYTTLMADGPQHARQYQVQVSTALGQATGQGTSQKAAQAQAAQALLHILFPSS